MKSLALQSFPQPPSLIAGALRHGLSASCLRPVFPESAASFIIDTDAWGRLRFIDSGLVESLNAIIDSKGEEGSAGGQSAISNSIYIVSQEKHHFIKDLPSSHDRFFNKKPLLDLESAIGLVYEECQKENWDGHGAEPVRHFRQSMRFAESLFKESRRLVESVDVMPVNDGSLCFEWFKSDNKFISVSVKGEKLIYHYKIGDEKGCGETNFSGKRLLMSQIKRVS